MRKFLQNFMLLIIVIISVMACQKNELESALPEGTAILHARIEVKPDTKLSFTENNSSIDISWEKDDKFTIYDADGNLFSNLKCISVSDIEGVFLIAKPFNIGAGYTAIYPASTAATLSEAKAEMMDKLLEQDGSLINNLSDACYMMADFTYSQDATISFKHQLAVMTFKFNSTKPINKLEFNDGGVDGETYSVINLNCEANNSYTSYIMIKPTDIKNITNNKAKERTLSFTLYNGENIYSSYATQSTVAFNTGSNYTSPFTDLNGIVLSDNIGTADNPIKISTTDELYAVMSLINNYPEKYSDLNYKVLNDINLSETKSVTKATNDTQILTSSNFTPIGSEEYPFKGVFNGNGHKISGLSINCEDAFVGFFGYTDGAIIEKLTIEGTTSSSAAESSVGGIVAVAENKTLIINCSSNVTVNGGNTGGIVGTIINSSVVNSSNKGLISGTSSSGGIIGATGNSATVTNCYDIRGENNTGYYYAISTLTNSDYTSTIGNQTSSGATSMTLDEIKSEKFVKILNNGVYEYNSSSKSIKACVWKAVANDFPIFDYDNTDASFTYLPAGGSGTKNEPYLISTADGISDLSKFVASGENTNGLYFELTKDINLGGIDSNGNVIEENEFTAIGNNDKRFKGIFDGGGHEISGLYINKAEAENQGLFGAINESTIKNLGVSGIIKGKKFTGGIAGIIDNRSKIIGCYNKATITGSEDVGGIVGCIYRGSSIVGCYNVGNVTNNHDNSASGGIVGGAVYGCYITSCYNTGKICASSGVGGILGKNYESTTHISSCYWIAAVDGNAEWGIASNSTNNGATKLNDISALNSSETNCPISVMNNNAKSETGENPTFVAGTTLETDTPKLWYE